ncbi:MAG: c-type cytochrome [Acidobacteriota bacterium]
MNRNDAWKMACIGGAALLLLLTAACGGGADTEAEGVMRAHSPMERGKYIVEAVSTCGDCHTPRLETGAPDISRALQGAQLGFAPTAPVPGWMAVAPPISGGPAGWSEAQIVTFLETGRKPDGSMARPPMPLFRLNHEDAVGVASYLRSLPAPAARSGAEPAPAKEIKG